ncbi:MAG: GNAT family N-acetyltransferase [Candidatus Thermoplasmatota archaeon]|nr:GNAT family N-acetyltransferase [Candidatus Thermoplasmatota archaeon]
MMVIRNDIRPGDLGSLVRLHGVIYRDEYGFDHVFESYVGEYMSRTFRELREGERVWIVEDGGEVLGCIAIVRHTDDQAQLRWFLLHPKVRGKGIGRSLLDAALDFARVSGYSSVFLLTESVLEVAASLYQKAGFELTWERRERKWGSGLIRQRYDLML